MITLTTTGTVSFLVAKVLKFEFNKYQPLTYNVMLVLLSFVITWGEVWFFDLKMIPLERKAREVWGDQQVSDCDWLIITILCSDWLIASYSLF